MCSGTPCSWAIAATDRVVFDRQGPPHRVGVGVLDDDQAGDRLVRIRGIAKGLPDLAEVHRAVGPFVQCPDRSPDDHRVARSLVEDDVALDTRRSSPVRARDGPSGQRGCPSFRTTTNRPASLPSSSAARSSSALTVGSSPKTSSPTSASAMARRISGVGRVTVSERRSITSMGVGRIPRRPHGRSAKGLVSVRSGSV